MFSRSSVIRRLRPVYSSILPKSRFCYSSTSSTSSDSSDSSDSKTHATSTVDPEEVAKFASQAAKWWQPNGPAAPLHRLNPVRLSYIRASIEKHLIPPSGLNAHSSRKPLTGVDIVDVGCGGGIVTEPLTRLGANVLGIDMSKESIDVARQHAWNDPELRASPFLRYETCAAEHLVKSGETFHAVLALEIIEHVPDPTTFLREITDLVRPGGILILSTINRTALSYALAIIAVERILSWLPPGTHDWSRFVTPHAISDILSRHSSLHVHEVVGTVLNPLTGRFAIVDNTDVNYILTAVNTQTSDTLPIEKPEPSKEEST